MDWNKGTILRFISLIKTRPAIWDCQSPQYKKKYKRNDAVEEVAMLMGVTTEEVNSKWTVIKNQFNSEKRKILGSSADSVYTPKWYAYKEMECVMPGNKPKPSENMLEENSSSSNQQLPPKNSPPTTPTPLGENSGFENERKVFDTKSYREVTLRVLRENKNNAANSKDDLDIYGLYIAAHLRKYSSQFQSRAKYEINKILYKLDEVDLEQQYSSEEELKYSSGPDSVDGN